MSPLDGKPTPKGVIEMDEAAYNAHPAERNSSLGYALKSLAHYRAHKQQPIESTDAQAFGTAAHFGVLEPQKFYARYAAMPVGTDLRTTSGKAAKAAILESGKTPLKADEFQDVERIIEAVYSHPTASKYLTGGVTEHSYFWTDPETGIQCKARPDYLREDGIYVDLKTTDDASAGEFSRSAAKWAYHRQAAFYQDGLKHATGRDLVGCVLIAVEKESPYGIGVFVLDETAVDFGRIQYKAALSAIAEGRRTNVWPGYPTETQTIFLPGWMK